MPQISGYILELWLTDSGLIQRHREEFVDFLEIERDFTNYPDILDKLYGIDHAEEVESLYEWEADRKE